MRRGDSFHVEFLTTEFGINEGANQRLFCCVASWSSVVSRKSAVFEGT